MNIIKTILLIATAAPLTAAHTLLRGNLPTEQYITSDSLLLGTSWTATGKSWLSLFDCLSNHMY